MTTLQVRSVGSYGFDVTSLTGAGLTPTEVSTTQTRVNAAEQLAEAIRVALTTARSSGAQTFKPSDALLSLPPGMSASDRDTLFHQVIGRAFSGGPMDLQAWSRAIDALEHWAGAQASQLPPGEGGGSRNVRGIWYVNGQAWSLSELFTANRVNTLAQIDRMVADSLNVIAANNSAAKALTGLMSRLFDKYYTMSNSAQVLKSEVQAAGQADADYPISLDDLRAYASKYIGSGAMVEKLFDPKIPEFLLAPAPAAGHYGYVVGDRVLYQGTYYEVYAIQSAGTSGIKVGNPTSLPTNTDYWRPFEPDPALSKDDFRAMIDEVETIIGAFGSDNQVAQLRNETLFNSRSNLLEGLSSFLKGQQTTRSTLARNA